MNRLTFYVLSALLAVGFLFRAVPALAQGAIVVDSTGAEVGPFENISGADSALHTIGKNTFALQVNKKGFVATGVTFSYSTGACTGTRYVQSLTSNSLYISYPNTTSSSLGTSGNFNGGVVGSTLYYAKPKTSASMTINSILVVGTTGTTQVCYPISATTEKVSEVAITDLSNLQFVPPFTLSF